MLPRSGAIPGGATRSCPTYVAYQRVLQREVPKRGW